MVLSGAKDHSPEAAHTLLAQAAEKVRTNPYVKNVETKILEGNPKNAIISLAQNQCDLLVMGSRRPSMQKMLFGSVS